MYGIISILNIALLILISTWISWRIFFFLTMINILSTTIYYIASIFIDVMTHFLKKSIGKITLSFWRDQYFKFSFLVSQSVFFLFWSLLILGPNFMEIKYTTESIILNFYLHGVACQIVLLDLYISDHTHHENISKDILIMSIIMVTYVSIQLFSQYILNFNIYAYQNTFSLIQLIIFYLISYYIFLNLYQLYVYLIKRKNGKIRKDLPSDLQL